MARLYADGDFDVPIVKALRRLGHDVLTVYEAGRGGKGIGDPDVLAFAISQGRAVLTHNRRDYFRLHRQVQAHSGIIVCTRDKNAAALASRVNQALSRCADLSNQLIRVVRPRRTK